MTEIQSILVEVQRAGASLRVEGEKLKAAPAGALPEALKIRIREWRPHIIRWLKEAPSDRALTASAALLIDSDIRVAVFVTETDAGLRISGECLVKGEAEALQAWHKGGIVFDPGEMLAYIELSPAERKLLLGLKSIL